ncbi:MAG: diguanylate cyclase, partial [Gammaproteobacteria bacterium]|nr:diguanylate cyclase [Gammaproteobacteria bacterium]
MSVLPRSALADLMAGAINAASNGSVGVLLVEIVEFPDVNADLGYRAGEALLDSLGSKLDAALRPVDMVVATGFGQIGVIVPYLKNPGHGVLAANKVMRVLAEAGAATLETPATCRIGIALWPEHGATAEGVVQRAEVALDEARARRSDLVIAEPAPDEAPAQLAMRRALEKAIEENALTLHFQPKIDLRRQRLNGSEALSRWVSP